MHTNDLTRGPLAKTLILFALPFLGGNLLQTLYGIVDLYIVGQFSDAVNLAAVSVGSLIMGSVNCVLIGLTTGGTVLVGQFLGAGDKEKAERAVANAFTLYPLVGIALAVLLFVFAAPLLRLMNTPAESFSQTLDYVRICAFGVFFTAGYNCLAGILRGMGDSNKPLLFVVIACAVNIVGDLLLVRVFRMGAAGAAIATTGAQAISLIAGILYIRRKDFPFDFRVRSFTLRGGHVRTLLHLGIPLALQEGMVMVSFLIVEAVINGMGYIAAAGAGVCDRIFMVATVPATSFSAAVAAMVAQNMGAKKFDRCKQCTLLSIAMALGLGLCIFVWMQFAPESVAGIFTPDKAVIEAACQYLYCAKFEFVLCSILFCVSGFINGTGHTRFTLWSNLIAAFCVRIPLVLLFASREGATLFHVGLALPFSAVIQIAAALIYVGTGKWRKGVLGDAPGAESSM